MINARPATPAPILSNARVNQKQTATPLNFSLSQAAPPTVREVKRRPRDRAVRGVCLSWSRMAVRPQCVSRPDERRRQKLMMTARVRVVT